MRASVCVQLLHDDCSWDTPECAGFSSVRRRHDQHLQRIPDSDSWVHIGVLQGRDRGFVNLTVPQAYMASMQGAGAKAYRLPVPAQS